MSTHDLANAALHRPPLASCHPSGSALGATLAHTYTMPGEIKYRLAQSDTTQIMPVSPVMLTRYTNMNNAIATGPRREDQERKVPRRSVLQHERPELLGSEVG
jgi:hypothetical protein